MSEIDTTSPPDNPAGAEESAELRNELLHADEYTEYILHTPREILAILRQVVEHGDLTTVYFNEGKDFLLTSLLDADEKGIKLDRGSSAEMNLRALKAPKLFCVTRHNKVKLQFILNGMRETTHEGVKGFAASLPESLLRLQRREFYRLTTPITRPLFCRIPLMRADGTFDSFDVHVVDISAGGIAVLNPPNIIPFETDTEFANCALELPDVGVINVNLKISNSYEVTLRNGQISRRSGCQFIDLPPTTQNHIQRYIIKIERERKARESGLA